METSNFRNFPGSLVVKTSPSNPGVVGSMIPGWGAKIPHTLQSKHQNIKQKLYCNKSAKRLLKESIFTVENLAHTTLAK